MTNGTGSLIARVATRALPPHVQILIDLAIAGSTLLYNEVSNNNRSDELDDDLEVILDAIQRLDQALIDSQEGKDIQLARLERLQEALTAQNQAIYGDLMAKVDEEGIEKNEILENLHEPSKLRTYGEAMPLWELSEQLRASLDTIAALAPQIESRRQELESEQSATPAFTPEEAVTAFAPSADMQNRITAFEASMGRLADPLLPNLEERIKSLSDVLEDCAAMGCCGDGTSPVGVRSPAPEIAEVANTKVAVDELGIKTTETIDKIKTSGTEAAEQLGQVIDG